MCNTTTNNYSKRCNPSQGSDEFVIQTFDHRLKTCLPAGRSKVYDPVSEMQSKETGSIELAQKGSLRTLLDGLV